MDVPFDINSGPKKTKNKVKINRGTLRTLKTSLDLDTVFPPELEGPASAEAAQLPVDTLEVTNGQEEDKIEVLSDQDSSVREVDSDENHIIDPYKVIN